jgi:hypothetical protein
MTQPNWELWRAMLAGQSTESFPFTDGDATIYPGYWHRADFTPVAIWMDARGEWRAMIGDRKVQDRAVIAREFSTLMRVKRGGKAVSYEAYQAKIGADRVPFPAEAAALAVKADVFQEPSTQPELETALAALAGLGHNNPPPEHVLVKERLDSVLAGLAALAGKDLADHQTHLVASEIKKALTDLADEADRKRVVEKEPHLKASREVDARWMPIVKAATDAKRRAGEHAKVYLDKLAAEQKAAREAAKAQVEAAGITPAASGALAVSEAPRSISVGGVRLQSRKVTEITDLPAVAAYFASMADPPVELIAELRKLAHRVLIAGTSVPGATLRQEEYVV